MRFRHEVSVVLFVTSLFALPVLSAQQKAPAGFAVVELFTSEGCSSCPPADEALSQLVREADQQKLPIYALEWHVDYWDNLGWKDPWDSGFATARQYAYARALPSSVYTPQVVINGHLVPSYAGDLGALEAGARSEASQAPAGTLSLRALQESPTSIRVVLTMAGSTVDAKVLLAEVEGDLKARPNAGENAGRNLVHSNVVRAVKVVPAASGEVTLDVPRPASGTSRRVIALLQNPSTLRIYAAAEAALATDGDSSLSGRIIDAAGKPVPGAPIQACSGRVCIPATTDAAGYFTLTGVQPGSYEIDFASPAAASVRFFEHSETIHIEKTVWRFATPAGLLD
jgi:hypothetical protein